MGVCFAKFMEKREELRFDADSERLLQQIANTDKRLEKMEIKKKECDDNLRIIAQHIKDDKKITKENNDLYKDWKAKRNQLIATMKAISGSRDTLAFTHMQLSLARVNKDNAKVLEKFSVSAKNIKTSANHNIRVVEQHADNMQEIQETSKEIHDTMTQSNKDMQFNIDDDSGNGDYTVDDELKDILEEATMMEVVNAPTKSVQSSSVTTSIAPTSRTFSKNKDDRDPDASDEPLILASSGKKSDEDQNEYLLGNFA
jgi:uncharacterized FlaG/YvyC family protein